MATYDLTQRSDKNPNSQLANIGGPIVVKSARFNAASALAVKGSAPATSDVFQLINIPLGSFVLSVTHKVVTAEGATCTYALGDAGTAAGYVVAATSGNGNTTTNLSSFNGTTTPTFGVGKYYTAADFLNLTLATGTANTLVLDVTVTYINVIPSAL